MATLKSSSIHSKGKLYKYVRVRWKEGGRARSRSFPATGQGWTDAQAFLDEAELRERLAGAGLSASPVQQAPVLTVADWLARWLGAKADQDIAASHLDGLRRAADLWGEWCAEAPEIRTTADLDGATLGRFNAWLRDAGLGPKTRRNHLSAVQQALRWAQARRLVGPDVLAGSPRIKVPEQTRRYLSPDERERLLAALEGDWLGPLVLCALYTGLRRSELLALRAEHVDLAAGEIVLPGEATKNSRAARLQIHDRLVPVLDEAVRQAGSGPLFTLPDGSAPKPGTVTRRFCRICRRIKGLEDVTFHALRHSFCLAWARTGASAWEVRRQARHASIQTTQRYVNDAGLDRPDINRLQ